MKCARNSVAIVLLLASSAIAAGLEQQQSIWSSRLFGVPEGLPPGGILAIAQDSDGYLWLGSDLGLVRFDGFAFRIWTPAAGPSFVGRSVRALLAAKDGDLWVGFAGNGGVSRIRRGRVVNYSTRDGVPNGFVNAFLEDSAGTVWVGARGGLARLRGARWELVPLAYGSSTDATVYAVYEDRAGMLWVSTSEGLQRRSKGMNDFSVVRRDVRGEITEDAAGSIWTTHPTRTFEMLDAPVERKIGIRGEPGQGSAILRDADNALWIGTSTHGLWRVTPDARLAERLSEERAPGTEVVDAIHQDREGTIWVATRGGLLRFVKREVVTLTAREGLMNNTVRALETDHDGSVWLGTPDGLQRFTSSGGRVSSVQYPLPDGVIAVARGQRRLWVGTIRGLGEFRNGQYHPLPLPPETHVTTILSMASTADEALWFCHTGAPAPMRWFGGSVSSFERDPVIMGRPCTTMVADSAGRLWIGNGDGSLAVYTEGRFRLFLPQEGLAGGSILALSPGRAGVLWLGSANGITRFSEGRFVAVTERNGLPGGNITAIHEDPNGNLWGRFSSGIFRISAAEVDVVARRPDHRVRHASWGPDDGVLLPSTRYAVPSATRGGDGRLWFQAVSGVAILDPARLRATRPSVRVSVDRVVADGRDLPVDAGRFTIPPRTSQVQIQYSALSLVGSPKVRFGYWLDGIDRNWIEGGTVRQAVYTRLPPGEYRFRVRATIDGVERAVADTNLAVSAAFYETWWFYSASVAAFALVVAGAWTFRLRMLRARHHVVLEERARIAREIHDTLLQSMAGIAMKLEEKALTATSDQAGEMRQVRQEIERHIGEARRAIAALRSPALDERTLATALIDAARRLGDNGAAVETVVTGQPRPLPSDIEHELLQVALEAIRNATRHARAQRILVELCYEHDGLRLRISDDGIGFDPGDAESGEHFGMRGMRERVERMGGTLHVTSYQAAGTVIEAYINRQAGSPAERLGGSSGPAAYSHSVR